MSTKNLTARHRSMLRAIADGRGQIVVRRPVNLTVDGAIAPTARTRSGVEVLAILTS